ncbi:VOC family protein [Aureimonas fodinaquatilis]|uniref:VOC family protein n=1 Tax=Aureimonas fodinaquatilis TaxID=2565783 RepID=A0A5B0DZ92_9HYPH|nr:VOC family protein [Aureimonas fodinaquatilis]KAA0972137.1 VOC family protein [Aureimonas fodinaquatilis]
MTNRQGIPIWYELISADADAAERFYGHVLGWQFERMPATPELDYRVANAGSTAVSGVMQQPAGEDMPRRWLVYFGVDDVDSSAQTAEQVGASIHVPPTDIPDVGRFAFLSDPFGALFYLMRGASEEDSQAFKCGQRAPQGHAVWNELTSPDPDAAIAFYGTLLGLRKEGGMPMGELGEYSFIHAGPNCIGAVMGEVPNGQAGWLVYFAVDDIDAAVERFGQAGGTAIQGPDEIPGNCFAFVGEDDQGSRFGLVGPRTR